MFPKIAVSQNGWVKIMEIPIKMDDLGGKFTISGNPQLFPPTEIRPLKRKPGKTFVDRPLRAVLGVGMAGMKWKRFTYWFFCLKRSELWS